MEELLAHVGAELKKPEEEISDELIFLINSRIKPPRPVTREQIFIRTMFLVSDEINSYGGRFPLEELHRIAELVIDSPVMSITESTRSVPWDLCLSCRNARSAAGI